ncbi:MAG: nucleotidyltransferase domain-containing protein [Methanomassiliicoccaceae archaeon]|nr:nucleotidyltransferase domain-containing protein [Methanomassiliicoccaceae archaeon]
MNLAHGTRFSVEELKEIIRPIAKEYGVKKVYLFGSMARGDQNEESDYDICVERGRIDCLLKYSSFCYDLRNAIGHDVDIITTKGAERKPEFLKTILTEGVVLYG